MGQLNLCVETIHHFEGINVTVLESVRLIFVFIPVTPLPHYCQLNG